MKMNNYILIMLLVLVCFSLKGFANEPNDLQEKKNILVEKGTPDQFLKASNWMYDNLIDKSATDKERELAAKTLRFAITGLKDDYKAIQLEIEKSYLSSIEYGRSQLRFVLTKNYIERAQRYKDISLSCEINTEPFEALDTILKAIYYDINNWHYWAIASDLFVSKTEDPDAIFDTEKAILYGKIAISIDPRQPYSYYGLVLGNLKSKQYQEAIKISTKALELAKFEDSTVQWLRGDSGRSYFTGYKGVCFLETGDILGAREYLKTAVELNGEGKVWIEPYLIRAMEPLVDKAIPIVLGNVNAMGYAFQRNGQSNIIENIGDNTPAQMAGLQINDIVMTINGFPPSLVEIEYNDKVFKGEIEYAIYEIKRADTIVYYKLIRAKSFPVGETEIIGCSFNPKTCAIVDVTPGSPAENAGWSKGDVLININGKSPKNNEGQIILEDIKKDIISGKVSEAIVTIKRGQQNKYFVIFKKQ
jgi:tetratricopeptide (TPR) repeat protein